MPKPAPSRIAEIRMPTEVPVGEKMKNSRPRNVPNHAPEMAPAPPARPHVSLPVMRSTVVRSVPTIASSFTGNSALASESTAACASGYVSNVATVSPFGRVGYARPMRPPNGDWLVTSPFSHAYDTGPREAAGLGHAGSKLEA